MERKKKRKTVELGSQTKLSITTPIDPKATVKPPEKKTKKKVGEEEKGY